jgi:hypothetical protein
MPGAMSGKSSYAAVTPKSSLRASGRAASRFRTGEIGGLRI